MSLRSSVGILIIVWLLVLSWVMLFVPLTANSLVIRMVVIPIFLVEWMVVFVGPQVRLRVRTFWIVFVVVGRSGHESERV